MCVSLRPCTLAGSKEQKSLSSRAPSAPTPPPAVSTVSEEEGARTSARTRSPTLARIQTPALLSSFSTASGSVCRRFGRLTLVFNRIHPNPGLENRQRGFSWGPWGVSWGAEGAPPPAAPLGPWLPTPAAGLNVSQGPRAGRPPRPDGRLAAQDEGHSPGTGQGRSRALHWSVLRRRNSSQSTREDPARLSWDVGKEGVRGPGMFRRPRG